MLIEERGREKSKLHFPVPSFRQRLSTMKDHVPAPSFGKRPTKPKTTQGAAAIGQTVGTTSPRSDSPYVPPPCFGKRPTKAKTTSALSIGTTAGATSPRSDSPFERLAKIDVCRDEEFKLIKAQCTEAFAILEDTDEHVSYFLSDVVDTMSGLHILYAINRKIYGLWTKAQKEEAQVRENNIAIAMNYRAQVRDRC